MEPEWEKHLVIFLAALTVASICDGESFGHRYLANSGALRIARVFFTPLRDLIGPLSS
jgi:hypothetical protein